MYVLVMRKGVGTTLFDTTILEKLEMSVFLIKCYFI